MKLMILPDPETLGADHNALAMLQQIRPECLIQVWQSDGSRNHWVLWLHCPSARRSPRSPPPKRPESTRAADLGVTHYAPKGRQPNRVGASTHPVGEKSPEPPSTRRS